jgi:hypothetical protein
MVLPSRAGRVIAILLNERPPLGRVLKRRISTDGTELRCHGPRHSVLKVFVPAERFAGLAAPEQRLYREAQIINGK